MSIFDYEFFFGGDDELAVSKEKYTKEEAIDLAKQQFDLPPHYGPYYLCVCDCFVRHRGAVDEDGNPCVCWWLEYEEHKRSCPCWAFHVIPVKGIDSFSLKSQYEYILVE